MNDIAQLFFSGGGMILPAGTPYERELLVDCVEATAKRHGNLKLHMHGQSWIVGANRSALPVCSVCSQWPETLAFPGGASGTLSVVSSGACACRDRGCARTPSDANGVA
jgi:hypothetical protein